eukprot:PhF_6_TR3705/c0_g1_i2/m.5285
MAKNDVEDEIRIVLSNVVGQEAELLQAREKIRTSFADIFETISTLPQKSSVFDTKLHLLQTQLNQLDQNTDTMLRDRSKLSELYQKRENAANVKSQQITKMLNDHIFQLKQQATAPAVELERLRKQLSVTKTHLKALHKKFREGTSELRAAVEGLKRVVSQGIDWSAALVGDLVEQYSDTVADMTWLSASSEFAAPTATILPVRTHHHRSSHTIGTQWEPPNTLISLTSHLRIPHVLKRHLHLEARAHVDIKRLRSEVTALWTRSVFWCAYYKDCLMMHSRRRGQEDQELEDDMRPVWQDRYEMWANRCLASQRMKGGMNLLYNKVEGPDGSGGPKWNHPDRVFLGNQMFYLPSVRNTYTANTIPTPPRTSQSRQPKLLPSPNTNARRHQKAAGQQGRGGGGGGGRSYQVVPRTRE